MNAVDDVKPVLNSIENKTKERRRRKTLTTISTKRCSARTYHATQRIYARHQNTKCSNPEIRESSVFDKCLASSSSSPFVRNVGFQMNNNIFNSIYVCELRMRLRQVRYPLNSTEPVVSSVCVCALSKRGKICIATNRNSISVCSRTKCTPHTTNEII